MEPPHSVVPFLCFQDAPFHFLTAGAAADLVAKEGEELSGCRILTADGKDSRNSMDE